MRRVLALDFIDPAQPALRNCLVITTPHGETRLRGTLPSGARELSSVRCHESHLYLRYAL